MIMRESRRSFLRRVFAAAVATGGLVRERDLLAQSPVAPRIRSVRTPILDIGFEESGSPDGFPVILLHGFPDDVRAWDGVAAPLAASGYRALVPYLRGFGSTRFRDASAQRTAEQAAIGQDVIDFADA